MSGSKHDHITTKTRFRGLLEVLIRTQPGVQSASKTTLLQYGPITVSLIIKRIQRYQSFDIAGNIRRDGPGYR